MAIKINTPTFANSTVTNKSSFSSSLRKRLAQTCSSSRETNHMTIVKPSETWVRVLHKPPKPSTPLELFYAVKNILQKYPGKPLIIKYSNGRLNGGRRAKYWDGSIFMRQPIKNNAAILRLSNTGDSLNIDEVTNPHYYSTTDRENVAHTFLTDTFEEVHSVSPDNLRIIFDKIRNRNGEDF